VEFFWILSFLLDVNIVGKSRRYQNCHDFIGACSLRTHPRSCTARTIATSEHYSSPLPGTIAAGRINGVCLNF
jgi:hypothetical protein